MPRSVTPVVAQWLDHLEEQGKSKHTVSAYRRALSHFENWSRTTYGSDFDIATTIPRDVRDWQSYQQRTEKAAPATVNQRVVALSRFFQWAHRQKVIETNPAEDVKSLRLPARHPKGLPPRDLRRLLRAVHTSGNTRDAAIIEMLAGTGLRVGELLSLSVGDIEIKERSGVVTVRQGKNRNYREVPLTKDVRYALAAYLERHPDKLNPDAPLWIGTRGPLSHRSSILRVLTKYTHLAKIDDIGPHVLRHTFATRYLDANPDDLRGLAALLGHSNLNTVMVYTEPHLDTLAERMERIELGG